MNVMLKHDLEMEKPFLSAPCFIQWLSISQISFGTSMHRNAYKRFQFECSGYQKNSLKNIEQKWQRKVDSIMMKS